ncbi:MAG: hypothetical protein OIF57_02480 [Marinobacterium sp.]|nr:hypothetical protein [Marinobacterium sp.]
MKLLLLPDDLSVSRWSLKVLSLAAGALLTVVLQGCLPVRPPPAAGSACQYSEQEEKKLQAAINAAHRWDVSAALILGLMEPSGPPWVQPRVLDWDEFRMQAENWQANPHELEDSAQFIGWFSHNSQQRIQLQGAQVSHHYMALRLGHGGYHRGLDMASAGLKGEAEQAQQRTAYWQQRLQQCPVTLQAEVGGSRWWKNILN